MAPMPGPRRCGAREARSGGRYSAAGRIAAGSMIVPPMVDRPEGMILVRTHVLSRIASPSASTIASVTFWIISWC